MTRSRPMLPFALAMLASVAVQGMRVDDDHQRTLSDGKERHHAARASSLAEISDHDEAKTTAKATESYVNGVLASIQEFAKASVITEALQSKLQSAGHQLSRLAEIRSLPAALSAKIHQALVGLKILPGGSNTAVQAQAVKAPIKGSMKAPATKHQALAQATSNEAPVDAGVKSKTKVAAKEKSRAAVDEPTGDLHVMTNGCPAKNAHFSGTSVSKFERDVVTSDRTAAVFCCSQDGSRCSGSAADCKTDATFTEASFTCHSKGMRLCKEAELDANLCCDAGCNYNGTGGVWAAATESALDDFDTTTAEPAASVYSLSDTAGRLAAADSAKYSPEEASVIAGWDAEAERTKVQNNFGYDKEYDATLANRVDVEEDAIQKERVMKDAVQKTSKVHGASQEDSAAISASVPDYLSRVPDYNEMERSKYIDMVGKQPQLEMAIGKHPTDREASPPTPLPTDAAVPFGWQDRADYSNGSGAGNDQHTDEEAAPTVHQASDVAAIAMINGNTPLNTAQSVSDAFDGEVTAEASSEVQQQVAAQDSTQAPQQVAQPASLLDKAESPEVTPAPEVACAEGAIKDGFDEEAHKAAVDSIKIGAVSAKGRSAGAGEDKKAMFDAGMPLWDAKPENKAATNPQEYVLAAEEKAEEEEKQRQVAEVAEAKRQAVEDGKSTIKVGRHPKAAEDLQLLKASAHDMSQAGTKKRIDNNANREGGAEWCLYQDGKSGEKRGPKECDAVVVCKWVDDACQNRPSAEHELMEAQAALTTVAPPTLDLYDRLEAIQTPADRGNRAAAGGEDGARVADAAKEMSDHIQEKIAFSKKAPLAERQANTNAAVAAHATNTPYQATGEVAQQAGQDHQVEAQAAPLAADDAADQAEVAPSSTAAAAGAQAEVPVAAISPTVAALHVKAAEQAEDKEIPADSGDEVQGSDVDEAAAEAADMEAADNDYLVQQ